MRFVRRGHRCARQERRERRRAVRAENEGEKGGEADGENRGAGAGAERHDRYGTIVPARRPPRRYEKRISKREKINLTIFFDSRQLSRIKWVL